MHFVFPIVDQHRQFSEWLWGDYSSNVFFPWDLFTSSGAEPDLLQPVMEVGKSDYLVFFTVKKKKEKS